MTTGLVVSIVSSSTACGTCASTVEEMMMCIDLGLGLLWRRGWMGKELFATYVDVTYAGDCAGVATVVCRCCR